MLLQHIYITLNLFTAVIAKLKFHSRIRRLFRGNNRINILVKLLAHYEFLITELI